MQVKMSILLTETEIGVNLKRMSPIADVFPDKWECFRLERTDYEKEK